MAPSLLIAIGVLVLYIVLGPLVILAISVYLDRLMGASRNQQKRRNRQTHEEKDPAVWGAKDVQAYLIESRKAVLDAENAGKQE